MTIQILGGGCPNCKALEKNARKAAERVGVDYTIEKITDMDTIMEMGVLRTPAYAFNGVVEDSGRVFSTDEIEAVLRARKQ